MDIQSLIADEKTSAWVKYPTAVGDFELHLRFVPRKEFRDMVQEATVRSYDPRTRGRNDEIDSAKLAELVSGRLVLGWKGLSIAVLRKLVPVKAVENATEETEVEFSKDNLKGLLDSSLDFENWLIAVAMDPATFSSTESYENLAKSQPGSPKTD